ncbi:MAG TPA: UdgX family uracil-DNA binding protein, partial [Ochrobactrum intermedium]
AAETSPAAGAVAISTRYRAAMPQAAELPQTMIEARAAAGHCRRCGLCEAATQTVWGEGPEDTELMIVGEQPGDREDLEGRPFVGPAGHLLREAMVAAGAEVRQTWLTNAVKHFKFTPRGKRRLHQNPERQEILHCRWWLGLELAFIRPRMVVALGASAAFALTDNNAPLTSRRGQAEIGLHGGPVLISWHPSYILRLNDSVARERARRELIEDIIQAARMGVSV